MTRNNGYAGCLIYVRMSAADIRRARQLARAQAGGDRARERELLDELVAEKITSHTSDCLDYAKDERWPVLAVYSDNMISGSARYRRVSDVLAGRDAMLADLREREGQRIVVLSTEVERLYRDMDESRELVRMARRTPITVVSTDGEEYDLSTANGESAFEGAVSKAQREAGKVSERRRRQERRRAEKGGYWGNEPFGYHKVYETDRETGQRYYTGRLTACTGSCCPAAGIRADDWLRTRPPALADVPPCTHHGNGCRLEPGRPLQLGPEFWRYDPLRDDTVADDDDAVIVTGEAELIQLAALEVKSGASLGAVTRGWENIGVTTRNGERWTQMMIRNLLLNKRLQGIRVHRPGSKWGRADRKGEGTETPGQWPAILDDETAAAVRGVLTSPDRYKHVTTGPHRAAVAHLLAGLAECGRTWGPEGGYREGQACGTKMAGHPTPRTRRDDDGPRPRQYSCPKVHGGCGRCHRDVRAADLWVIQHVLAWTAPGGRYEEFCDRERALHDAGRAARDAEIAAIETDKASLRAQRDRVSTAITDGVAAGEIQHGDDMWKMLSGKRHEIDDELAAGAARQAKLLSGDAGPERLHEHFEDIKATLLDPDAPVAVKAELVRRLVAKVIISPPGQGTRTFDPATVRVIPGPWADEFTAGELAIAAPAGKRTRSARDQVTDWLAEHPASTTRQVAEGCGMSQSFAATTLAKMRDAGTVTPDGPVVSGRSRNPVRYTLPA